MGIQGLLPILKSIMSPIHIKDLGEGCSVAIDTYSWLHKGALSCSKDLCKGLPTSKHIDYCMHRVNLLSHYGVKPVLVFDGGFLPMKSEQENKRGRARKENLARAIEHESNGNNAGAYECYQKAVDVSPSMAYELIQVLKKENVSYIVAPYEADAQMTFLAISNQVDAVITEDSDLIAFGCPRIIYKMDKFGQGVEFRYAKLQQNKDLNLTGFTKQMVLEMCILSGCDYLQSLPGLGLKKAHALVKKYKSYDKVIKHLRYSTVAVSPGYEEAFEKAIFTFRHQRVYDPAIEDIVHLSELSDDIGSDLDFLGPYIPQHIGKGIAVGDIDPLTKMPFQGMEKNADLEVDGWGSYELKHFKIGPKKLELPVQKNLLTNYFCFASLEANRKYRAPRSTESPQASSLPDLGNLDILSPPNVIRSSGTDFLKHWALAWCPICNSPIAEVAKAVEERGFESLDPQTHDQLGTVGDKRSLQEPLHQKAQPIHKPCTTVHKQYVSKPVTYVDGSKIRTEHSDVIVRSRYFQHKPAGKSGLNTENEKLLCKDDVIMGECESPILSCENKNGLVESGASAGLKKRKTTARSSYFQEKSAIDVHDKDDRSEENKTKDGFCAHLSDNLVPERVQLDMGHYSIGTKASYPSNSTSSLENTDMKENTEVGKFGSNISHLENYSDIAVKSMERFVSVISSFRCSPNSGSRASGLRAPLKDIRNTSTQRSTTDVEFSKFAYVPTKKKALPRRTYCRR